MKERLTGAIILVALLVLLVPELLTGPEPHEPTKVAGADGAQLRSYTIDLQGDSSGQPPPPTTAPATAVADDPVAEATPDYEAGSPSAANVSPPVDDATRAQGRPMGSGADASAAAADQQATAAGSSSVKSGESAKLVASSSPSADDDRPRSAFGPNARPQPDKSASGGKPDASSSTASKAAVAKADTQKAEAAKAEAAKAEAARAAAAKAEAQKAEAARAAAAKAEAAKAEAARLAAAKAESARSQPTAKSETAKAGSKGWAVQLGVFGSRDNAERLAKQVKGSGFPVLLNESSGKDGKKLYWVRVGPEADAAAAAALSTKLKAAGHRDARVVAYP